MNRSAKKMRMEGSSSRKPSYSMIHSGHYMTSCLHDNENDDDTVEMPIASPDATNNEVTAAAAAELEAASAAATSVKSASTTALSSVTAAETGPVHSGVDVLATTRTSKGGDDVTDANSPGVSVSDAGPKGRRMMLQKSARMTGRASGDTTQIVTVNGDEQARIITADNLMNLKSEANGNIHRFCEITLSNRLVLSIFFKV